MRYSQYGESVKTFAVLPIAVLLLAGCAPTTQNTTDPDVESVIAVETAFLDALVEGDGNAALALTTLSVDEVTCAALFTDYADLRYGVSRPEVAKATISGEAATVEFSYWLTIDVRDEQVSATHTLVRDGDEWLIEFPEEYRIVGTFPDDVVAEAGFTRVTDPSDTELECVGSPVDGVYEVMALPGRYIAIASDPSDVFYQSDAFVWITVYDGAESGQPLELPYEDPNGINIVRAQVRDELNLYVERCVASGLTGPDCPSGIPAPEGLVSTTDRLQLDNITLFSDDGETWRFRASGQSFLFERNGAIEDHEMYYTGTVTHDYDNELYVIVTVE